MHTNVVKGHVEFAKFYQDVKFCIVEFEIHSTSQDLAWRGAMSASALINF